VASRERAERKQIHRNRNQQHCRPAPVDSRSEDHRQLERSQAALDDLLEPEVLDGVAETVGEQERKVAGEHMTQPTETDVREPAREDECGDREQHTVHAVVVSVVDRLVQTRHPRLCSELVGLVEPAQSGQVEREAQIGRHPGECHADEDDPQNDPREVAWLSAPGLTGTGSSRCDDRQNDRKRCPKG
jgi:hypothetical protein